MGVNVLGLVWGIYYGFLMRILLFNLRLYIVCLFVCL